MSDRELREVLEQIEAILRQGVYNPRREVAKEILDWMNTRPPTGQEQGWEEIHQAISDYIIHWSGHGGTFSTGIDLKDLAKYIARRRPSSRQAPGGAKKITPVESKEDVEAYANDPEVQEWMNAPMGKPPAQDQGWDWEKVIEESALFRYAKALHELIKPKRPEDDVPFRGDEFINLLAYSIRTLLTRRDSRRKLDVTEVNHCIWQVDEKVSLPYRMKVAEAICNRFSPPEPRQGLSEADKKELGRRLQQVIPAKLTDEELGGLVLFVLDKCAVFKPTEPRKGLDRLLTALRRISEYRAVNGDEWPAKEAKKALAAFTQPAEREVPTARELCDVTAHLVEKHFPKGKCKERGAALVLHAEMLVAIQSYNEAHGKGKKL